MSPNNNTAGIPLSTKSRTISHSKCVLPIPPFPVTKIARFPALFIKLISNNLAIKGRVEITSHNSSKYCAGKVHIYEAINPLQLLLLYVPAPFFFSKRFFSTSNIFIKFCLHSFIFFNTCVSSLSSYESESKTILSVCNCSTISVIPFLLSAKTRSPSS